jgi:hypothetical protein
MMANPLITSFLVNRLDPAALQPPALGTSIAMPSGAPSFGTPITPSITVNPKLGTPLEQAQGEYQRQVTSGSGIDQIQNPLVRGIARAGDIAASVFAPRLAQAIPGTTLHHQLTMGQAANTAKTLEEEQDTAAQTAQRQALASQEQSKAAALANPQKAVDPSKTVQTDDGVFQLNPDTGKYDIRVGDRVEKPQSIEQQAYDYAIKSGKNPLDAFGAVYGAKNQKDANLPQQYLDAISSGDTVKAGLIKKVIQDTQVQPKIDVHAAESPRDVGTWTPGFDKDKNPILFNTKTGEVKPNAAGFTKATAAGAKLSSDEQKRADLAKNMNENIDALDDIASRRPELFGPVAGRYTELRNTIGTSDPDITKLEAIKHQLGMVAQGAHGMRSAQGVESAANSLVNNFHNTAEATKAGLDAARTSVRTFLDDANNPGQSRGAGEAHQIKVGNKTYQYKGSGPTDDMASYTEVKK